MKDIFKLSHDEVCTMMQCAVYHDAATTPHQDLRSEFFRSRLCVCVFLFFFLLANPSLAIFLTFVTFSNSHLICQFITLSALDPELSPLDDMHIYPVEKKSKGRKEASATSGVKSFRQFRLRIIGYGDERIFSG